MGQAQRKTAEDLEGLSGSALDRAEGEIVDEKMEERCGKPGIKVGLEQRFELLVDALADGPLTEAVAAGDVERRHQGLPVGEQIKGHGRDGRRGTHRIQLGGVREHDGQHSDALEKIKHAQ